MRTPSGELPPRARRIHVPVDSAGVVFGTTSACAENTGVLVDLALDIGNYLRVRGEYSPAQYQVGYQAELPPRARRIPWDDTNRWLTDGTTSACAENTRKWLNISVRIGNYLRVRGEYLGITWCCRISWNYLRVRGEYPPG